MNNDRNGLGIIGTVMLGFVLVLIASTVAKLAMEMWQGIVVIILLLGLYRIILRR